MNPLVCKLSRWIVRCRLDDGRELPRWVRRHQERCAACRHQWALERDVVARLFRAAGARISEPPPFLQSRILANLDAVPAPENSFAGWSPAGALMVTLAATAIFLVTHARHDWNSRPPRAAAGSENVAAVDQELLPAPQAIALVGENIDAPLEQELKLVVSDAQTALTALSRNLLPTEFAF